MTMMTETLVSGTTPVSDNVNLKQHLNTPSEEGQSRQPDRSAKPSVFRRA
ncbi:hypothetical protein ACIF4X_27740, partial [Pseudomonas sp. NPDC085632]